jgi:adenosylmethionine-8-amino-7-oxononanoate aminotransferase
MRALAGFHTFDRFTNEPADALCEVLASLAPMDGARVFLTSSGSEAVDSAIKLARQAHVRAGHPERTTVVGRRHSYHGVTYGGISVQGLPLNQEGFGPLLDGTAQVSHDDLADVAELLGREGTASPPCSPSRSSGRAACCRRRPATSRACAACATTPGRSSSSTR